MFDSEIQVNKQTDAVGIFAAFASPEITLKFRHQDMPSPLSSDPPTRSSLVLDEGPIDFQINEVVNEIMVEASSGICQESTR